ncbi:polyisoprenoid-binding protein [Candidatus Marinamargulisbacteria bacterium SCGC AG-414-C22]|nr:polyisoprenoid-binding protein [Candidatus Marinamargulisbacteria bacterium SCGC AG-414-C22]
MRLSTVFTLLCLWLVTLSSVQAKEFIIDHSHTRVGFEIKHLVVAKVRGQFNNFTGRINWNPDKVSKSSMTGIVQVNSIDTNNTKRDQHLLSSDFFNANEYDTCTFTSTKIKKTKQKNVVNVTGLLTIKDVTKKISFPVTIAGPITGPRGRQRYGFEAEFTIDRFDYGLTWSRALETGELVVGRDVTVTIAAELIEAK